jgi:hypothetical protein
MIQVTTKALHETSGTPLVTGPMIDLGTYESDNEKQKALINTILHLKKIGLREPFVAIDLSKPADIDIVDLEGNPVPWDETAGHASDDYNGSVKLICSARDIVEYEMIKGVAIGHAMVKVNEMLPIYMWFRAANLMLDWFDNKEVRVIPFPFLQTDGRQVFHMLPVNVREYGLYQQVLEYGLSVEHPGKAFETSGKMSYEILSQRGIKQLTGAQVDQMLCHIMVGHNEGVIRGALVHRAGKEQLGELRDNYFLFY